MVNTRRDFLAVSILNAISIEHPLSSRSSKRMG